MLKKFFISFGTASIILAGSLNPVLANTTGMARIDGGGYETMWWPGDPNPEPGTEAWLQLHGNVTTNDSTVARRCALEAVGSSIAPSSIYSWVAKGAFSVASFGLAFGIDWTYNYWKCIINASFS